MHIRAYENAYRQFRFSCKNIFMALFPLQPIFLNMQQNRPKKSDYGDVVLKSGSQVRYVHLYLV